MAYISEIRGRGLSDDDFVEFTLAPGDDVSNITITTYNSDGTLSQSFGSADFTFLGTDGDGNDVYVLETPITVFSGLNGPSAIALDNDGTLETFVAAGNADVTAIGGPADGQTADANPDAPYDAGQSGFYDESGYVGAGPSTPGEPPCFVAGTLIETENGPLAIETLVAGDRVETRDGGLQEVLWVGSVTYQPGQFRHAPQALPVEISAGTLGATRDLRVSPLHRVLVEGDLAQILFGEQEVLVQASDLINDSTIRHVIPDAPVTYVHVLLSEHHLLLTEGLVSESLQLSSKSATLFPEPVLEELRTAYPGAKRDLDGMPTPVRRFVKSHEARLLRQPAP